MLNQDREKLLRAVNVFILKDKECVQLAVGKISNAQPGAWTQANKERTILATEIQALIKDYLPQ